MNIPSYYWVCFWVGADVPPEVHATVEKLDTSELPIEERKAALLQLLASDSVVARGLALDFFRMTSANLRWCNDPMIENAIVEDAVRTAALRELAAPPYERTEPGAEPRRGANHASALALKALGHGADAADVPLLARVLHENDDPQVLHEGVHAAGAVLWGEPAHKELVDVLSQIASRRDLDPDTRAGAIDAIGGTADEAVTPLLVASLADPELAVSVAAARSLLDRDLERHRPLVAPIAAAWHTGEFPTYKVHEVRRLLEDASEAV